MEHNAALLVTSWRGANTTRHPANPLAYLYFIPSNQLTLKPLSPENRPHIFFIVVQTFYSSPQRMKKFTWAFQ
jgi:hypothetical protein